MMQLIYLGDDNGGVRRAAALHEDTRKTQRGKRKAEEIDGKAAMLMDGVGRNGGPMLGGMDIDAGGVPVVNA